MFHNPWVNKSVLRSSDILILSKFYKYPGYNSIWNSFDWKFEDLFFLFYKVKCVHLKNQAPLIFSLHTRSALGTQFVHARIFFKLFSNSFHSYFKFARKFAYFYIFFCMFVSICFKKPVVLFNLLQICFKSEKICFKMKRNLLIF